MTSRTRKLRRRLSGRERGPTAVYARVLDGDHLWLAVEGVAADTGFALEVAGGPPVPLAPEETGVLGGGRAGIELRADLLELPLPPVAPGEAWSGRLLAVTGLRSAPVALPAPAEEDATTTPRSSRGWWQHAVRRGPDGELVLERAGHPPWAEVLAVEADDERLRAVLSPPPGRGEARDGLAPALVDGEWRELCRLEARAGGDAAGRLEVRVPPDVPVPAGTGARLVLVAGDDPAGSAAAVLVRRRRHELTMPDASVSLPGIVDAAAEKPLLRWRWFPDGTLAVQRPRAASAAPGGGVSR